MSDSDHPTPDQAAAQATPEKGGALVDLAARSLIEDLQAFSAEAAPA